MSQLQHFHVNAKAKNFVQNCNKLAELKAKAFSALQKYVQLQRKFYTGGYLHSNNVADINFPTTYSVFEIRCELFPNTHLYTGNTYDVTVAESTIYSKWEFKATGLLKELHEGTDGFTKLTFQLIQTTDEPQVTPTVTDFTTALREANGILHDETCMCQKCMEERQHEFPIHTLQKTGILFRGSKKDKEIPLGDVGRERTPDRLQRTEPSPPAT